MLRFLRLLFNNRGSVKIRFYRSPDGDGGGGDGGDGGDGGGGDGGDPQGSAGAAGDGAGGDGGDGGEKPSWMDVFPDEAKTELQTAGFKTADDFWKSHKSQNELIGRKGVIIPKDDASPEEKEKFLMAIGRPEKPDGYKFSEVKDLHGSITNPGEIQKGLAEVFHKIGLPNSMADGLGQEFLGLLSESAKMQEQAQKEASQNTEAALRKEWGEKYDANVAMAGKVAAQILGKEGLEGIGGPEGLGNNPYFNKLVHGLASKLSEDTIKDLTGAPATGKGTDAAGAQQMIDRIEKDTSSEEYKAFLDENHPKHKEIVQKRQDMYSIVYGSGAEA